MSILLFMILCGVSQQAQKKTGAYDSLTEITNKQRKFKDNPLIKLLEPLLESLKLRTQINETKAENQDQIQLNSEQIKQELKKYQNQTAKKWNLGMIDFVPDDIISFVLENQEVLFETVQQPTVMRGAYFIADYQKQKVKLTIRTPTNITIFEKESDSDTFFLPLEEIGEYKFIFSHKVTSYLFKKAENMLVTFALDIHNSHSDIIEIEDLDPINQQIEAIHISMRDKYFYAKLFQQQYNENLNFIQNANHNLLLYSSIEVFGTLIITLWQIWYIRRVLSTEKLI